MGFFLESPTISKKQEALLLDRCRYFEKKYYDHYKDCIICNCEIVKEFIF